MKLLLLALAMLGSASALLVGTAPVAISQRVAASPHMACNGGKGGSGGMAPKKDKMRRGKMKALIQAVRSAPPLASFNILCVLFCLLPPARRCSGACSSCCVHVCVCKYIYFAG
jgi:hypothetical protein